MISRFHAMFGRDRDLVVVTGIIVGVTTGPSASVHKGKGFTVAYSATGIYTVTFTPSTAKGYSIVSLVTGLGATTPADIKGHTVITEAFSTTSFKANVYNASDAAHALVDAEYLHFQAILKNTTAGA